MGQKRKKIQEAGSSPTVPENGMQNSETISQDPAVENKKAKKNKKQKLNENIAVPDEVPKKQSKKKNAAKDGDGIEGGVPAEAGTESLTEGKKKKESKSKGIAEETAADPKVDSAVEAQKAGGKPKKSKKAKKGAVEVLPTPTQSSAIPEPAAEPLAKAKKKSKKADKAEPAAADDVSASNPSSALPKPVAEASGKAEKKAKKKNSKKGGAEDVSVPTPCGVLPVVEDRGQTKKKKDKKSQDDVACVLVTSSDAPAGVVPEGNAKSVKGGKKRGAAILEEGSADGPELSGKKDKRKKRKGDAGNAVSEENGEVQATTVVSAPMDVIPAENGVVTPSVGKGSGQKTKSEEHQLPSGSRSFQRVKAEEWLNKKGAWNNSYAATFGESGWGAKAEAVLGTVRGKDFRHEKTKKKRGSYRGGAISSEAVNSFKFDSDED